MALKEHCYHFQVSDWGNPQNLERTPSFVKSYFIFIDFLFDFWLLYDQKQNSSAPIQHFILRVAAKRKARIVAGLETGD